MNSSRVIGFFTVLILIFTNAACSGALPTVNSSESENNIEMETNTNSQVRPTSQKDADSQIVHQNPSSSLERTSGDIPPSELQTLAGGMNNFAVNLLKQINKNPDENLIFSPYSISLALAMAYAGAGGKTAEEMAQVLNFNLPPEELYKQLNSLDQSLYVIPEHLKDQDGSFQLNVANSLWGQSGYPFRQSYFDLLAQYYGAGLQVVDFTKNSDQARSQINDWVSEETEGKIKDLIPPGGVNSLTRLVLANAIYFNAAWLHQFSKQETHPDDFYLNADSKQTAQMMQIKNHFEYKRDAEIQLVDIPYLNDRYSMVLVMPLEKDLSALISELDNDQINSWMQNLSSREVILRTPKFKFETSFSVNQALKELGLETAFSPTDADFSGMYQPDGEPLYISEVIHKAFVDVDEEGTEAAAATAIVMRASDALPENEPLLLEFNHPFLFIIRDHQSGLILFVGKVSNPAG